MVPNAIWGLTLESLLFLYIHDSEVGTTYWFPKDNYNQYDKGCRPRRKCRGVGSGTLLLVLSPLVLAPYPTLLKVLLMIETVRVRWVHKGWVLVQQKDHTFLGARHRLSPVGTLW